jgi:mono/diheme cytochrome c family protein
MRAVLLALLAVAGPLACSREKPAVIYMPDMVYSPAYKAQKPGSLRLPVAGTVSRDFEAYPYAAHRDPNETPRIGRWLENPLPPTRAVLERGRKVFNTFCIVCHGPEGEGDGTVVPKFPRPPSLQSEKIRGYPDGSIFHVITVGQNLMPSYASQIPAEDRWAGIHYLRALQRKRGVR